jgi:ABC-2 type transport system permease protein
MNAVTAALVDARAMTSREVRRTLRSVDGLIMALVLPVSILTMFVFVFGGALQTGSRYIDYVVPGVLLLCAGYGAAGTAVSVAQDLASGTIDRFRTMPIVPSSVLIGHVTASVARNLVAAALVTGVAVLYGWRPAFSAPGWLAAAGLLVLYVLAITWIACAVGLVASPDAAQGLAFFLLFLPYLSSGFVPPDTLPSALRAFAEHQPITPIVETLRALLTNGTADQALVATAWLAGLLLIGVTLSTATFTRRP